MCNPPSASPTPALHCCGLLLETGPRTAEENLEPLNPPKKITIRKNKKSEEDEGVVKTKKRGKRNEMKILNMEKGSRLNVDDKFEGK